MRIRAGTSGFSYKEWKGPFYPDAIKGADMLGYYASRLSTVEINNTFYRMPKTSVLENWARQVPDDFVFVIKAPRRITHVQRLKDSDDAVGHLFAALAVLGAKRGPVLFQLPPFFQKDVDTLARFVRALPRGNRAVFEFRHPSWHADDRDDVGAVLADAGAGLCVADTEEGTTPLLATAPEARRLAARLRRVATRRLATAPFGYLRLRRPDYDDAALTNWAARIKKTSYDEAFVFFKHEDGGTGPRLAARLEELSR